MILYNRNYEFENVGKGIGRLTKVEERRKQLMEMMTNNSRITIAELSNELNVTIRMIERDIEKLKEKGLITRIVGLNEG